MSVSRKLLLTGMLLVITACSGGGGGTSDGNTSTSGWVFTDDNFDFGITDLVSPEAVLLSDGTVRLYTTEVGNIGIYAAAAPATGDLTFAQQTTGISTPGFASDPTLIAFSNTSWRLYYVDHSDPNGTAVVMSASSSDGLNFGTGVPTGISTTNPMAWGVPDSVLLPDGRVRLYWVDMVSGQSSEVIKSAISTDGITFTEEAGYRTTGGYVDPHIIRAVDGDWLAVFSTSPGPVLQTLHIGTSSDGLTWSVDANPIVSLSGGNALDPASLDLGDGSYRIYYVATTGADASTGYYLKSGVLSKP